MAGIFAIGGWSIPKCKFSFWRGCLRHGAVDDVGFSQGCDVELLLVVARWLKLKLEGLELHLGERIIGLYIFFPPWPMLLFID